MSELKRRIAGSADLIVLDGAGKPPATSAEMHAYACKPAQTRLSGRAQTPSSCR
jgi:hypothetical protein